MFSVGGGSLDSEFIAILWSKGEAEQWKNDLKINEEQTINWKTFNMSILNALWGIVSSHRFDLNNVEEIEKFEVMNALFNSLF